MTICHYVESTNDDPTKTSTLRVQRFNWGIWGQTCLSGGPASLQTGFFELFPLFAQGVGEIWWMEEFVTDLSCMENTLIWGLLWGFPEVAYISLTSEWFFEWLFSLFKWMIWGSKLNDQSSKLIHRENVESRLPNFCLWQGLW